MKIFACANFSGHYLGGCAVVVAEDESQARIMLASKLASIGLEQNNGPERFVFTVVDPETPSTLILWDGDY